MSEYEKIEIVKIHLFCIIQLYILGVLYENMNTSIKYVLQGPDEIKKVYRYFQKRCSYGMNHIFTTGTVNFSPNKSHNIGRDICTRTFGAVNFLLLLLFFLIVYLTDLTTLTFYIICRFCQNKDFLR